MNNKFVKKILVMLAAICLMVTMVVPAFAEEGKVTATGTTDDPANGILQVMLAYVDDGGNRTYFSSGTCFLINDEYVVTNKHVFDLETTDADGVTLRELIMQGMGLSKLEPNDSHLKLYVFANRDTNVEATLDENAQSDVLDFAALKLSRKIVGREPLVIGDSAGIKQQDTVYALGFPADSIQNKEFNTKEDVSVTDGIISKVTVTGSVDIIEHTAQLNNGNSGGPLLNANNEVIGINEFIVGKKGYSIQINAVKEILDGFGISYATSGAASTVAEPDTDAVETVADEPAEPDADLVTALQSEITKAKNLDTKGYTEESVKVLNDSISEAERVAGDTSVTNAQVTTATDELKAAVNGLEKKSGPNFILIGGIAAGVVVVIIVIVIVAVSSGKKKKSNARPVAPQGGNPVPPMNPQPRPVSPVQPTPAQPQPPYGGMEGAGETTLLDSGAGETTLLGGGAGSAYLIRRKNGEKIVINQQNFAIGKERNRVNYCISDNTSVSRYHVVITKKGSDYYAADQKSSNFTCVNGVQLSPYKETLLTDKSTLKISDEEFEFHLS